EKEDSILGSILLPSFHISMLSVDDHISRKYAFKATHPNMRTYYFCTDTAKEMESWMKVMTDAALVHTEPTRRLDKLKVDQRTPHELNNLLNHRVLTRPEIQNNERNREPLRQHSLSRVDDKRQKDIEKHNGQREREYYTLQRDGERYSLKKDGVSYTVQKDGDRYLLHKDGEKYLLRKDGEKSVLQKDGDVCAIHRDMEKYAVQKVDEKYTVMPMEDKYAPSKDGEKYLLTKDGEKYALQKVGDRHTLQKDGQKYVPQKEVKRQLSLKETERYSTMSDNKYGTIQVVDKYGTVKEVKKYSTLREGDKYATLTDVQKYATVRGGDKYGFQRDPSAERTLTKISSIKLQPAQAAAIAAAVSASRQGQANLNVQKPVQVNGSGSTSGEQQTGDCSPAEVDASLAGGPLKSPAPVQEPERGLSRTNSMQQLEHWLCCSVSPPSSPCIILCPCSDLELKAFCVTTDVYLIWGVLAFSRCLAGCTEERSGTEVQRADVFDFSTVYSRQSGVFLTLKFSLTDCGVFWCKAWRAHSANSITSYQTLPRNMPSHRAQIVPRYPEGYRTLPRNSMVRPDSICSVAGSVYDRALRPASTTTVTTAEKRRSMRDDTMWQLYEWQQRQAYSRQSLAQPTGVGHYGTLPTTKTMGNISEHTVAHSIPTSPSHGSLALYSTFSPPRQQVAHNPNSTHSEVSSPVFRGDATLDHRHKTQLAKYGYQPDRRSIAAGVPPQTITPQSLQGKTISPEDYKDGSFIQRTEEADIDELDRSWREYDRMGADVTLAKTNLLEQLEALGSPQTEPPSQRHIQIQKELWRIQDVMEALAKNKPQRSTDCSFPGSKPLSSIQKNEAVTLLPLSPLEEGDSVPPRPPLPQYYDSSERPPHVPPHHSHTSGRLAGHTHRPEDRKAGSRNGAHSNEEVRCSSVILNFMYKGLDSPAIKADAERMILCFWVVFHSSFRLSSSQRDVIFYEWFPKESHVLYPEIKRPYNGSSRLTERAERDRTSAPDYRLYKSEPELTTVKEEVDEANGEDKDKTESSGESKDATGSKVPPYPVGIVPPRTKSPMSPPESSTIASYVTLRKTKKPESRSDRPRSAVDQTGFGEREVGRMRMSVEEQLERMRRNQEASSLREKKRETPSRSPSFSKENPFIILQNRVQAEGACADPVELEAALQQLKVAHMEQSRMAAEATPQEVQRAEEVQHDRDVTLQSGMEPQAETNSIHTEVQPGLTFQTPEPETPSPEPREEDPDVTQQTTREEKLEKSLDSSNQLTADDKKHSNNNNNMLASQTFTLVTSDT
ncbi:Pleckstrin homology domain-containing family A member 5, partial [Larimichthys crocea]